VNRIPRIARRVFVIGSIMVWSFLLMYAVGAASNARAAAAEAGPRLEQRRDTPQVSERTIEDDVMCPTCDAPLSQSNSPAAERMRVWIRAAVQAGWTRAEIRDGLVREYNGDESILTVPHSGLSHLLVWLVPGLLVLGALLGGIVTIGGWRRGGDARPPRMS
jgi:cytochrome c-type biogenesis protein CcmH/NrfF